MVYCTVGDFIILDSDIEVLFNCLVKVIQWKIYQVSDLGKLLDDKLYAHQAIQIVPKDGCCREG
jgi:hypothetical protein